MALAQASVQDLIALGFSTFTANALFDHLAVGRSSKTMMEAYVLYVAGAYLATHPGGTLEEVYEIVRAGLVHAGGMTHDELSSLRLALWAGSNAH